MSWRQYVAAFASERGNQLSCYSPYIILRAEGKSMLYIHAPVEAKAASEFGFDLERVHAGGAELQDVEHIDSDFD